MAAKILRHPKSNKPLRGKKQRTAAAAPETDQPTGQRRRRRGAQRGRQNHRGYPEGQGPGGYAGAEGDETIVVCEANPKEKKKFPWGTILITGMVMTVGTIVVYKLNEKFTGDKRQTNPEPETGQQALLNARDYLLLSAPGAESAIGRIPQPPQVINAGPSQREIDLMEREAVLRERMAEMEGFIQGQVAAGQQKDGLAALLEAAEDD